MDYLIKDFGKILKKNALMMRRLLLQENTNCMRVYDRNLEELPLSVDLYDKYARITDYSEDGLSSEAEETVKDVVRRMCYVQGEYVIFHRREKRHNKEQHDVQSRNSLVLEVSEFSHRFKVDLIKRIDTGLFLDHYKTRKLVESISNNLNVLNLFAYTGSFSVYAASGGATLVESVDLSKTYTEWAQYNLNLNGFEGDKYPCINTDALEYIIESVRNKKQYDLVILDPPSFSNSRKMEKDFDIQRDYVRFLRLINNLLSKDGKVIFSTNLSSFHMDPGRLKGYKVKEITKDILADGFSRKKGTSRTWLLEKESKVKLSKEDYEGKKYFAKVISSQKKERVNKMDNDPKNDNDLEKIIADLEKDYEVNDIEVSENEGDDLVLRWDSTYESSGKKNSYNRKFKDERDFSKGSRDRNYSRDNRERRSSREDGDRKFSRNDGDRRYSRDNRDRRSSREDGDRSFSRNDGERRYSRDNRDRNYSREDGDRKFSRNDGERRYSRDNRDRNYSREDGDRKFSRNDGERRYSRDNRDRRSSREDGDRSFSRNDGEKRYSRDNRDRRNSREDGDRRYSRDNRDRRSSREDGDRKFSRNDGERRYSRDNRDNNSEENFGREKRVKRTKPVPYGFEKK